MQVNKIAVIGSGVMGSGIAAQAANGGMDVLLLDIVPEGAEDRNQLARSAVEKQLKSGGFAHATCAKLVQVGNLEDDLDALAEADWIIEVVVEKVEIKHKVYRQIDAVRKAGSIVSSNTSTIPLAKLMAPMPEGFQKDFAISHFFNPPRQMRLIEMVPSPSMDPARYQDICHMADTLFGKAVVHCKDTPGFIANRIGIYWLTLAMNKALEHGMAVEAVDQLLSKPIGVPKTGVFGLYDLIGLDLMPLIATAMQAYVPEGEPYHQLEAKPEFLARMIAEGYTGRKGKGGFYTMEKLPDGKRIKQVLDLSTGEYYPTLQAPMLQSAKAKNIAELLGTPDMGGEYARDVMVRSLHYAASLWGEIADDIDSIDRAMRHGYSWKYGPFELIDQIGTNQFATYCHALDLPTPEIIKLAGGQRLYHDGKQFMGQLYQPIPRAAGVLKLADAGPPKATFESGKLWDLGDQVFCLELTSKMHSIDGAGLDAIEAALSYATKHGKALVIGSEQPYFSAGANLNFFLDRARSGQLAEVDALIARGQQVMCSLKYAKIPVVSALTGVALGGGCEMLLHSAATQPHLECHTGLVEVGVGLIPGWGGCKEMLLRRVAGVAEGDKIAALTGLFSDIVHAKTARSAYEAMDLGILPTGVHITMNIDRLLGDAKQAALSLSANYQAPSKTELTLPTGSKAALAGWLTEHRSSLAPHQYHIAQQLAEVLASVENSLMSEQDLLDKERDTFMRLLATSPTQDRIEHMLNTGKVLEN